MAKTPVYDPNIPKKYYNSFGEKEWTRLTKDCSGELLYHVHMDVFRCYVNKAVALFNAIIRYLPVIAEEKKQFGIEATKWLMDRGIQDAQHYPVENENYLHMMKSRDLDALYESQNVQIIEKRAAGIFSLAGEEALDRAKADQELWDLLLHKELEFSKDSAYLNCGANLIYVVRKR